MVQDRQGNQVDLRSQRALFLAGPVLAALGLTGCADFWDEVTSKDFKVKTLFVHEDPVVVLRETSDGDSCASAAAW